MSYNFKYCAVNAAVITLNLPGPLWTGGPDGWDTIAAAALHLHEIECRPGFVWGETGSDFETVCASIGKHICQHQRPPSVKEIESML